MFTKNLFYGNSDLDINTVKIIYTYSATYIHLQYFLCKAFTSYFFLQTKTC